jgi:hypothetical protein
MQAEILPLFNDHQAALGPIKPRMTWIIADEFQQAEINADLDK